MILKIRFYLILFWAPVVLALIGVLFVDRSDLISSIFIIESIVVFVVVLTMLVCPVCAKSLYIRENHTGRVKIRFSAPWPETVCSRCGTDLRKLAKDLKK
jgi:uncharacterized protein YbaR (Trm112 family)